MLYSALSTNSDLYLSFHIEQVYQNFGFYEPDNEMADSQLGYFASELKIDTLERVKNNIKNLNPSQIKSVIIDCDGITESRNPSSEFDAILDFAHEKTISISLIRVGLKLYEDLKLKKHKQLLGNLVKESDSEHHSNFFLNCDVFDTADYDNFIFKKYQELLIKKIEGTYLEDNDNRFSNSSNIYLPKYINIKRFIEERELSYLGLYLLCKNAIKAKLIPDLKNRNESRKTLIFFQSLNGAYLASIIAKIALLDMAYIDHIGPINKIYRTILRNNFENQNLYVIMSDVICMGTEIEITKSLIQYENSIVKGNLTIVKIEAIKGKKELKTSSLFTLTKINNSSIKYKIETEFM
jgi:hypothetical protein